MGAPPPFPVSVRRDASAPHRPSSPPAYRRPSPPQGCRRGEGVPRWRLHLQRPPRGGVRAVCRGTRFERRMRVLVASPACPAHFGGRRTRNRRSAGHGSGRPCRWRACGCTTASGAQTPVRAPWTWLGVTPPLGKTSIGAGEDGAGQPHPPAAAGSLPAKQSLPEGCRAPLRGAGGPVGRTPGRWAVRHRRPRPGRARSGSPFGLPAWSCVRPRASGDGP